MELLIFIASFLHLIFPDLAAKTAYELFYSKVGQHTSVGNYWNDPHKQDMYLKFSVFLPYINNEIISGNSTDFKAALTSLDKFILIGGPNDGVITPWQSSHFGYYNDSLDVIPLNERKIYTSDDIGLKTLADHGKLIIIVKPFVHHLTWHTNPSESSSSISSLEFETPRNPSPPQVVQQLTSHIDVQVPDNASFPQFNCDGLRGDINEIESFMSRSDPGSEAEYHLQASKL
uniref:palmitoyl-CoA hydrolase n=1 Tax=Musca domestica TaxID=7370 RepID=A0A1I8NJL8_MUSDO